MPGKSQGKGESVNMAVSSRAHCESLEGDSKKTVRGGPQPVCGEHLYTLWSLCSCTVTLWLICLSHDRFGYS